MVMSQTLNSDTALLSPPPPLPHITGDMWRLTCNTWHLTHKKNVSRDTWHMWHVTCDMCHMTHRGWWTLCKNVRSLVLTVWERQCFEYFFKKDDSVTDLISDGCVTVSLGKGFGSNCKQHHKRTASETHNHTLWSRQVQRKIREYLPDRAYIPVLPPLTLVYLALYGKAGLYFTPGAVTLDPKMWQDNLFSLSASVWLCGSAAKWVLKTRCWWCCCR